MSIIPVHEFSPITSYDKSTRDGASYKNMESQMGGALVNGNRIQHGKLTA